MQLDVPSGVGSAKAETAWLIGDGQTFINAGHYICGPKGLIHKLAAASDASVVSKRYIQYCLIGDG